MSNPTIKRRTYQCFEIWRNYGKPDACFLNRTEDFIVANQLANKHVENSKDKIFILGVEVLITLERTE